MSQQQCPCNQAEREREKERARERERVDVGPFIVLSSLKLIGRGPILDTPLTMECTSMAHHVSFWPDCYKKILSLVSL